MMDEQDESRALADAMLAFRLDRQAFFPDGLFGETGWEFLLALFIADANGHKITGRQICGAIGATPSVAARWLKYLSAAALVDGDGSGDLDDPLTMSASALDRMESLLNRAKGMRSALLPVR